MKSLWLTPRCIGQRLHFAVTVCLALFAGGAALTGLPLPAVAAGAALATAADSGQANPESADGSLPAAGLNTRMTPADARHLLQRTGLGS